MTLAGVILAGGASRRMGRAKALLPYEGQTFLDRLIGSVGAACDSVTVVLGHEADSVRAGLRRAREAVFVVNERHEAGQLSSLQCGLRALAGDPELTLFVPVDHAAVRPETVRDVAAAARAADPRRELVLPRYQGQRGHPVVCGRALREALCALPEEGSAKPAVHAHLDGALFVDVTDPGVVRDVDTPDEYAALLAARTEAW